MEFRSWSPLALALALALGTAPARAEDPQAQAMGRALFNEGVGLFNTGRYAEACPKLEASLRFYPGLGTRGKLAECYERLGRTASAWAAYREVAQLAARSGDVVREQVASERAKALEPKLSYVTVVVPPSHDVAGLVVTRAGKPLDRSEIGAAAPVDPGVVPFEVRAPGRKPFLAQVQVGVAESARFEIPLLAPAEAPAPAQATAAPVEPAPDVPPAEAPRTPWQRPVGLALAGVGAVGVLVGGVFGLSASSTYDGAFEGGGCDRATLQCSAAGQSTVDDARSKATVSTVLFAAGGVLAAGGLVLFLTAPSERPTALKLAPSMHARGGGLVLSGSL